MNRTPIEWAKNPDGTQGHTWNPITGCDNQIDGLCQGGNFPCYAYRLANTRLRGRYLANDNVAKPIIQGELDVQTLNKALSNPFAPRFWPERVDQLDIGKQQYCQFKGSKGIFVCDMGELFGDGVPRGWQDRVFEVIKMNWHHRFYLLTKQPQNLVKFSPFPKNCWVGVTATGHQAFNEALDCLKGIEAEVKYISIEPLLERIPFYPERLAYCGVNQLIIGAQTKPYKPPEIEWVKGIVTGCDRPAVAVFLKDNLRRLIPFSEANSWLFESIPGIPTGYKLRQEMPK